MTTNSKEYSRKYYEEHKEAFKEASRRHREKVRLAKKVANPRLFDMREDYTTQTKEKFQEIPKKELTYAQKYYAENRERIRAQQKEKRARDKHNAKSRAYYAEHREHLCELQRKSYARKQRKKKLAKTFLWRLYLKIFW